jgi:hypothetical protein
VLTDLEAFLGLSVVSQTGNIQKEPKAAWSSVGLGVLDDHSILPFTFGATRMCSLLFINAQHSMNS